ncbi:MAG TPA: aminopeptidase [Clostridiales bacterium UBA8960]|nr:aminopeptidase [Clostridiales bacterium UBA8960]
MSDRLKKYAELLVKTGINLKKDQILVLRTPIECSEFARAIVEVAFDSGAKDVAVLWSDEVVSKIRYLKGADDLFDTMPSWQKEFYLSYVRQDAAFLSISASDPENLKDVDPVRIQKFSRVFSSEVAEYRKRMMNNENVECVASVPTPAWAKKVFPESDEKEAMYKLWDAIYEAVRVNEADPVAAWESHKQSLKRRMAKLNALNLASLHYTNGLGTDLHIELPEGHIWLGGSDLTPDGHEFIANMPTEEVFTAPKRDGVNGRVVSAMPLNFNGSLIDRFELTFEKGKVVSYKAEVGFEQLKRLLETDEGSMYLGEVALVQYDSPISNMGILFYNTLFDENASCHLALGKAYPVCFKGGETMDSQTLLANGINDSITHEDFMVGTEDLSIVGITQSGEHIQIFKDGNFVF